MSDQLFADKPSGARESECLIGEDEHVEASEATSDSGESEAMPEDLIQFEEASPELIAERDGVDIESYRLPPCPHVLRHPMRAMRWFVRAAFGIVSLVLLLAVIAAVPIVNFLALGYLLEVEARVARTGRLRDAFLLLDVAPRVGSIVLCVWLWLTPLRYLAMSRDDARIIEPGGSADQLLTTITPLAAALVALHLCLALARGGSFGCFFRPIKNIRWLRRRRREGDYLAHATAGVQDFTQRLRIRHHFWLGLRGFAGAFVWLVLPTTLFAASQPGKPGSIALTLLGGLSLILVFSWLPFLQARFALTGRFRAMFEVRAVRRLFGDAPIAWMFALLIVFVLSLPLYLPKAFLLPQDAMWIITLIFIVMIYPARVATGWALHRAIVREQPPWFGFRWMSRWIIVPMLTLYTLILFFTPLISQHGKGVLFEHHAFLLPVPF